MRAGEALDAQFRTGDFQEGVVLFLGELQRGCQELRDLPGGAPFIGFDFPDRRHRTAHQIGQLPLCQIQRFAALAKPGAK
jgi:hypothetical protein